MKVLRAGSQHGQGGVEVGNFGVDKAQVGDLGFGFVRELTDIVGFVVDGEGCHGEYLSKRYKKMWNKLIGI